MTTPIKTQCPHCQACLKIQQTQLNKTNATVSCEHCHQSFLVNKHLVVTPDVPKKAVSKVLIHDDMDIDDLIHDDMNTDDLIHDDMHTDDFDLIHDDMDIDESEDSIAEYDSLDTMDIWLTQASSASTAAAPKPSSQSPKADDKNSNTSLKKPSKTAMTEPAVLSSAAANNIHASIDNATDNSWLEQLLEEQNKNEDTLPDDTDLSQLLLEMGVPIKDEDNEALEERIKESQAKFVPSASKHSVASLLWTLGCLVLALLLFAQYVIFNLETLVKNPVHAQRLQAICSVAACSLPSADLTAFTITDSTHNSSRIQNTATFSDVSATLRNQSDKAQLYPNVKVRVYGANDLLGEFIATPTDYLLSKQHYLAANSEQKLLFTIPVANAQIREVAISPLY